jgi:hypothetical protein
MCYRTTIIIICSLMMFFSNAQVGLNTTMPEGALDISSSTNGVLLPRVNLLSAIDAITVINPNGGAVADGTMVWNTGATLVPAGFYYWQSGRWNKIVDDNKQVHFGRMVITSAGSRPITGIGFQPRSIEFTAVNRAQTLNERASRADGNNTNDIRMAGGRSSGYAIIQSGTIEQQALSNAYNGSSLNNIGSYASTNHCIAAFFVNNNGEPMHDNGTASNGTDAQNGLISASLTSFDPDGFTLNVDNFLAGSATNGRENQIVVIFKAYKY